jgi:hypothetical protein
MIKSHIVTAFAALLFAGVAHATVISGPYYYSGHTYVQISANTWTGAEAEAVTLGGHLVTINDAAENTWVRATFATAIGYGNWIGLNDAASEGNFVWSSGASVTYANWALGEPNNLGDEDFVHFWGGTDTWNDWASWGQNSAIVEINPVPDATSTLALLALALSAVGRVRWAARVRH